MPSLFTEDTYEQAIIELFENMGYEHLYAPDLDRDYTSPLLDAVLQASLVRINRGLPAEAIDEAISKLRNFDTGSLVQKNAIFMDYLQNGITVKFFVKGEERSSIVRLIDYMNVDHNTFYAVNQFTYIENPFLLKVHNDCAEGTITEDNLKEILRLCISYVLRRSICDIPTNSMNKTFATLRNSIRPDDYMNSVKAFFVLQDTYKEFPDNDKFMAAFMSRDIYTMRARNYILSRLENFGNKAPIIIENYTIEHIMPQNTSLSPEWQHDLGVNWKEIQKTYIHTIGNLTLTAYNSEMSDRPFMDKMNMPGGFKESALRLNAYLVKLTEWNEDHIKERAQQLAAKAVQIWPYPSLTNAELAPYTAEEKSAPKYTLETYDINAFTKILFETLDRRIMNLSPAVKREYKKLYIAYKLDTNFVDIVVQKQRLRISVNMKFSEVYDPNGICRDVTGLGRWGNGDVELFMEHTSDIDRVMEIIEQSYKLQAD